MFEVGQLEVRELDFLEMDRPAARGGGRAPTILLRFRKGMAEKVGSGPESPFQLKHVIEVRGNVAVLVMVYQVTVYDPGPRLMIFYKVFNHWGGGPYDRPYGLMLQAKNYQVIGVDEGQTVPSFYEEIPVYRPSQVAISRQLFEFLRWTDAEFEAALATVDMLKLVREVLRR